MAHPRHRSGRILCLAPLPVKKLAQNRSEHQDLGCSYSCHQTFLYARSSPNIAAAMARPAIAPPTKPRALTRSLSTLRTLPV